MEEEHAEYTQEQVEQGDGVEDRRQNLQYVEELKL
jgi:hypothetical protein